MAEWFVVRGDKTYGPFEDAQLKALARNGKLKPEDRVRHSDSPAVVLASAIKGLFSPISPLASPSEAEAEVRGERPTLSSAERPRAKNADPSFVPPQGHRPNAPADRQHSLNLPDLNSPLPDRYRYNIFERSLSVFAVIVSGTHLIMTGDLDTTWAIAYFCIGFFAVGWRDRYFAKRNQGKRITFGFGTLYFIAFFMVVPLGYIISKSMFHTNKVILQWGYYPLFASLFWWVACGGIEFFIKLFFDGFLAPAFGPGWNTANIDRVEGNHLNQGRAQQTGPCRLATEPEYTDFVPPLSWGFLCNLCGARCSSNDEDCWYCEEFGRHFYYKKRHPDFVNPKTLSYERHPSGDEPGYRNGRPPLSWQHKCQLCGARCSSVEEECWYCQENGRKWGWHAVLPCPFDPPRPDHHHGEGGHSMPTRPGR